MPHSPGVAVLLLMASNVPSRPHAVILPYPAQGHLTPMLQLAKLLHLRGFFITYINNEYNHHRLLRARGPESLTVLQDFRFEAISDGLPPSDNLDATQDIPSLCLSIRDNCGPPLRDLLMKLNRSDGVPPVSCIVADGFMSFSLDVGKELGLPVLEFWTMSACGFMCYLHFDELIKRGYTPLQDESYLTNGYLDTEIEWIPGMKNIRFKDLPSFVRTTDPNNIMLNLDREDAQRAYEASGVIINTFFDLEQDVLQVMDSMFPNRLYTIGPLFKLANEIEDTHLRSVGSNLWKEDATCLAWLNNQEKESVVYVNFGSITVMTAEDLKEFAWGLANSKQSFLWVIRADLVAGEKAVVPEEFVVETKERGFITSWCSQELVLAHSSVGVFLTHSGWNSTLESICNGVPMMCWPFFAEQPTNCRYVCKELGVGMEIDSNVRREEVEGLVREVMEGEKGREMRVRAKEWKKKAEEAVREDGSSCLSLDRLVCGLVAGRV